MTQQHPNQWIRKDEEILLKYKMSFDAYLAEKIEEDYSILFKGKK